MLAQISSVLNPFRGRATARPNTRTRLSLEGMEERLVPSVVFEPVLGEHAVWRGGNPVGQPALAPVTGPVTNNPTVLNHPTVYLIFAGTSWAPDRSGHSPADAMAADARAIINSKFFSGLTDYGSDGKAIYGGYAIDARPVDASIPWWSECAKEAVWEVPAHRNWIQPDQAGGDLRHSPIYVVVPDVGVNANNGTTMYYPPGNFFSPSYHTASINIASVRLGGGNLGSQGQRDVFTDLFSHEVAERISCGTGNGIEIDLNQKDANKNELYGQISDGEPDGMRYTSRLPGGQLVQAYWSLSKSAYVVPDGNSQQIVMNPIWNSGKLKFDMYVNGDQGGAHTPDTITVAAHKYANRGTTVTLNGQETSFDTGKIRNIYVNALGGNNRIDVTGVEAGVALKISNNNSLSSDTVVIGNGSLVGIAGTVNVSNSSGTTKLVIDDSHDSSGTPVSVTRSSVRVGSAQVNYGPGVSEVDLDLGTGNTNVFVGDTSPTTPVWVFAHSSNTRSGPGARQIHWLNVDRTGIIWTPIKFG
jgi:hypothetical protein